MWGSGELATSGLPAGGVRSKRKDDPREYYVSCLSMCDNVTSADSSSCPTRTPRVSARQTRNRREAARRGDETLSETRAFRFARRGAAPRARAASHRAVRENARVPLDVSSPRRRLLAGPVLASTPGRPRPRPTSRPARRATSSARGGARRAGARTNRRAAARTAKTALFLACEATPATTTRCHRRSA